MGRSDDEDPIPLPEGDGTGVKIDCRTLGWQDNAVSVRRTISINWRGHLAGHLVADSNAAITQLVTEERVKGDWKPLDGPETDAFLSKLEQASREVASSGFVEVDSPDEERRFWFALDRVRGGARLTIRRRQV